MTFQSLIAIAATFWLASVAACAVAPFIKRLWASVVLCLAALAMGYCGLTHFHLTASKTVNGHTQWAFDSRWFFIATLILAALSLGYRFWKNRATAAVH